MQVIGLCMYVLYVLISSQVELQSKWLMGWPACTCHACACHVMRCGKTKVQPASSATHHRPSLLIFRHCCYTAATLPWSLASHVPCPRNHLPILCVSYR